MKISPILKNIIDVVLNNLTESVWNQLQNISKIKFNLSVYIDNTNFAYSFTECNYQPIFKIANRQYDLYGNQYLPCWNWGVQVRFDFWVISDSRETVFE